MADDDLLGLMRAIAAGDIDLVEQIVRTSPELALDRLDVGATRSRSTDFWLGEIDHYVYAGDTALHVAAAAHRPRVAGSLLDLGAAVAAANRRGAQPLHYAADGSPGSSRWRPMDQAMVITLLINAGADPEAADRNGATPLHRAVRTRCADAVRALLEGGADPVRPNSNGSTPMNLAKRATGRGGSGSQPAKEQQAEIVRLLQAGTRR